MRRNLRQHVAVSRVDFSHWRCAFPADAYVGFVDVFVAHASGKIHYSNTYSGKRDGGYIIAIPVTIADAPLPLHLVQARAQRVSGRVTANERIGSSHGCERPRMPDKSLRRFYADIISLAMKTRIRRGPC